MSLTGCWESVSEPLFSFMERVVSFTYLALYHRAIVRIKWEGDRPSVTCRALRMCKICTL